MPPVWTGPHDIVLAKWSSAQMERVVRRLLAEGQHTRSPGSADWGA